MRKSLAPAVVLACLLLPACASAVPGADRIDLFGDPLPPGTGFYNIIITPQTRHINVTGGDMVNFIVGDKTFSWSFFVGSALRAFDLSRVAPPGVLDHPVMAYVAPDPRYWGKP